MSTLMSLAGLTLLLIGDSHMVIPEGLILTLHDQLLARGAKVVSLGACGVPAGAWVEPRTAGCGVSVREGAKPATIDKRPTALSWSIDAAIQRYRPDVVIVGISDTMASYHSKDLPSNWIDANVSELTHSLSIAHVSCVWYGPHWGTEGGPSFKTFARARLMADHLAADTKPCRFIDSTRLSTPGAWPTWDGVHYTPAGYKIFGKALAEALVLVVPSLVGESKKP